MSHVYVMMSPREMKTPAGECTELLMGGALEPHEMGLHEAELASEREPSARHCARKKLLPPTMPLVV